MDSDQALHLGILTLLKKTNIFQPAYEILSSAAFSKSIFFSKNYFRNTIRVTNSLDSDLARHCFGPDLSPNCLQRLSADDTSRSFTIYLLGNFSCFFCHLLTFYINFFSKNSLRNTLRVSISLDPDQA